MIDPENELDFTPLGFRSKARDPGGRPGLTKQSLSLANRNFPDISKNSKEFIPMSNQTSKTKTKRLPKGKRAHVRRLKQEAKAAGTVYKPGIE